MHIYLSTALLPYVWTRPHTVTCSKRVCTDRATHVRAELAPNARANQEPGRFAASIAHLSSAWCAAHLPQQQQKTGLEIVDELDRVHALLDEIDARFGESPLGARAVVAQTDAKRILRVRGRAGVLFEREGDLFEVQQTAADGMIYTETVCCYERGIWLIDARDRGRRLGAEHRHSMDCSGDAANLQRRRIPANA